MLTSFPACVVQRTSEIIEIDSENCCIYVQMVQVQESYQKSGKEIVEMRTYCITVDSTRKVRIPVSLEKLASYQIGQQIEWTFSGSTSDPAILDGRLTTSSSEDEDDWNNRWGIMAMPSDPFGVHPF